MSNNGAGVLAIRKIAHGTIGVSLHGGGCRLRRVGARVHMHSHVH